MTDDDADDGWRDDHWEEPCIMCGVVDTLNNLITLFAADECLKEHLPGYVEDEEGENYEGSDDDFIADPVHVHKDCLRKYQQTAWALRDLNMRATVKATPKRSTEPKPSEAKPPRR